jgi:outer membrane protein assembly factor BamB
VIVSLCAPLSVIANETTEPAPYGFINSAHPGNYNPEGLSDSIKNLWNAKIGGRNRFKGTPQSNPSSPLIVDNILYVGSSTGKFYAYSLDKGKRIWTFKASSAIHTSVLIDKRICFGTVGGELYCLDAENGKEIFKYSITSSISSAPVADSERIYFLSTNDRLYAIDPTSGEKVWTYSQRNRVDLTPRFMNTPTQSDDKLFILLSSGVLVALNKETGKELWQRSVLKGPGPWPGARRSPVYLDGNLYIIDKDGVLLVLDADTGSLRIVFDVAKAVDFVVTKDNIIIASTTELISVDRISANAVWIEALDEVASRRIYGAGDHIHVVSITEKEPMWGAYVVKKRATLSAYAIDDGTRLWKKKFRSGVSADVSVIKDHLAIFTDKGRLYVIGSKSE